MTDRDLMHQALGALEKSLPRLAPYGEQDWLDSKEAIDALRARLAQPEQPKMNRIAALKFSELRADGYVVCGVMIQRQNEDGTMKRGAVSDGGMVIWWHPEQYPVAKLTGIVMPAMETENEMADYKSMFEQAVRTLAAIDEALGIGDDGCGDPDQTLAAIAELKDLQKMEAQQLRKIHPLDFPIEIFLADLTTRPANIIRSELAMFASYAGTGTFDIEPPFTVRHLCMFSRSEMRKWPNFGRKCLNEVEEMLRARGLQLWENHDERSLRLLREHKEYFK